MLWTIHWAACALGVTGAIFVAFQRPLVGFSIWLPSNMLWIAWAAAERDMATGLMFVVYLCVTVLGLWRWRVKGPAAHPRQGAGGSAPGPS
jgi:hypothetical protein